MAAYREEAAADAKATERRAALRRTMTADSVDSEQSFFVSPRQDEVVVEQVRNVAF
jgi:hypothetical protein